MRNIPTIGQYIENEWTEADGLPGPAYAKKYGLRPKGFVPQKSAEFDSRRGMPIYGDCCDNNKQYVPYPVWQEAIAEINRMRHVIVTLEQALEAERGGK